MRMLRHVTGSGWVLTFMFTCLTCTCYVMSLGWEGVNVMSWVSPCWHHKCRMGTEVDTYIKQMLIFISNRCWYIYKTVDPELHVVSCSSFCCMSLLHLASRVPATSCGSPLAKKHVDHPWGTMQSIFKHNFGWRHEACNHSKGVFCIKKRIRKKTYSDSHRWGRCDVATVKVGHTM